MKTVQLGFVLIIGTLLVCFSFGSALSGEMKKPCPDSNIKYDTLDGEEYWKIFFDGFLSEVVQTEEYICARFSFQGEDAPYSYNILASIKEVENRKKKERGLLKGIKNLFESYDFLKHLKDDNKPVWSQIMEQFSELFIPNLEKVTGLKYKIADEWFDWWETNKDQLVLSEDGKYLIVRKNE
jgi:hypothetical protein